MTRYFLGVDTGATKSHALIADGSGRALGFGEGGPGNPDSVGHEGLADVLRAITQEALTGAGISKDEIAGAGFGIAGYDWPSFGGNVPCKPSARLDWTHRWKSSTMPSSACWRGRRRGGVSPSSQARVATVGVGTRSGEKPK